MPETLASVETKISDAAAAVARFVIARAGTPPTVTAEEARQIREQAAVLADAAADLDALAEAAEAA